MVGELAQKAELGTGAVDLFAGPTDDAGIRFDFDVAEAEDLRRLTFVPRSA